MIQKDSPNEYPARILMLVPHEPDLDPRVDWVIKLCAEIGRTDVLGFVHETKKPLRVYDQAIYLERVLYEIYPVSRTMKILDRAVYWALNPKAILSRIFYIVHHAAYLIVRSLPKGAEAIISKVRVMKARMGNRPNMPQSTATSSVIASTSTTERNDEKPSTPKQTCTERPNNNPILWIQNTWSRFYTHKMIAGALFQRAQASSIVPRVIVCHDIQALDAGVRLKKKFKSQLLYDSHEVWTESNLLGTALEKSLIKNSERRLIKHADVVITVAPQIARHLEKMYGIDHVLSVPNAEPFAASSYEDIRVTSPIKFLLQGQATPGRGFEEFLEIWEQLDDSRALLIIRCPENPFLACLKQRFKHLIDQGKIVIAAPVKEMDLIQASQFADIGIIPYTGPNLNHIYACPNKLSQYMQAGLAILHNSDQQFVTEIVNRHSCGVSYGLRGPHSLCDVVRNLMENPDLVREMKRNAYQAAQSDFNWEVKSKVYFKAIKQLFES